MARLRKVATASIQKMPRHEVSAITPDPASGASMGETEMTSMIAAIMRVASGPVCMSRMIARGTTMTAAPPKPWIARPRINWPGVWAKAQATVPIRKITAPI
jgi:hypothetical protein